jgi:hypothetical protein
MRQSVVEQAIEERIRRDPKNSIYMLSDFRDFGSYPAVKKALSRLTEEGKLFRVRRGIYKSPYYSSFLRKQVAASPLDIAKKIAEKNRWTIAPSGNTALNLLGLSTQVPAGYYFVSSGPYKEVELDSGTKLYFKILGKGRIDDPTRDRIRSLLSDIDKERLARESKTTRVWVADAIEKILATTCTA